MTDFTKLLANSIYYDKYAKYLEEENRYETWEEAVRRVMSMHERKFASQLAGSVELRAIFARIHTAFSERLILPSMRSLQFGGPQIEKNNLKQFNCSTTAIDRPRAFAEVFYALLCGVGAGFSVQKRHVSQLPPITMPRGEPVPYIIGDSVEGWADALNALMDSYFYDSLPFRFDYSRIRPKGAPVSGGIIAPGPDGLRRALEQIDSLLRNIAHVGSNRSPRGDRHSGVSLSPIQCYDALMHASEAVLSGGVRRSATICLFDPDDDEMINAKTGDWLNQNAQRARSNNSAILVRFRDHQEAVLGIGAENEGVGASRGSYSLTIPTIFGNPCVEAGLFPFTEDGRSGLQMCNLTECNAVAMRDKYAFFEACRTAAWLGTLQAAYTDFPFLTAESKEITEREALLGVSITGIMDNPMLSDPDLLARGAKVVKWANEQMARLIGVNTAARTTLVKPAGTTSILLGTASGIHPRHSRRYIRNVQLNRMSPVAKLFGQSNPCMVEDSVWGEDDVVVSFPIESPPEAVLRGELAAVRHLNRILAMQRHWVANGTRKELCVSEGLSHSVSATLTVNDAWDEILNAIWENRNLLSGISLVPDHSDKAYRQAPHIDIEGNKEAKARWDKIKRRARAVELEHAGSEEGQGGELAGGRGLQWRCVRVVGIKRKAPFGASLSLEVFFTSFPEGQLSCRVGSKSLCYGSRSHPLFYECRLSFPSGEFQSRIWCHTGCPGDDAPNPSP